MKKSIMLIGSFSGGNYGDSIVLTSLLSYLEAKSFTEVYIPSASPENTKKLLGKYDGALKLHYIDINMRRTYGYRFFNRQVIKSLKNIDYMAFTAGTIFFRDLFNPRRNFVFSVVLMLFWLRKYKIQLLGLFVGVNEDIKEYSGLKSFFAKKLFKSFNQVITRDYESYENVKSSFSQINVSRSYDVAFYNLLKKNEDFLIPKDYLNVNIGLNICEYLGKQVGKEVDINELKNYLVAISQGFEQVYWFHTTKMDENFVKQHILFDEKLSKPSIHIKLYEDLHLEEVYKEMDFFVGMRMHSLIPALAFGIPVVALNYNDKVKSLFGQLKGEHYVKELDKLSGLNIEGDTVRGFTLLDLQRKQIIQNVENIEI